jgi:O-antigen ligase
MLLPGIKDRKVYRSAFIFIIIAMANIILTQSRTIWIALTFGFTTFFLFYRRELTKITSKVFVPKTLIYGVLLFSLFFIIILPRIQLSLDTFYGGGGLDYRKNVIKEGLEVLAVNPLLGFGAQTNEYILLSYFPRGAVYNFPYPVHQGHLQFLLEFGIIGSLLFIAPFYLVFRRIINHSLAVKRYFSQRKDDIFIFVAGAIIFNIYYLFLSHGDIAEFQYLGLILGFGLIAIKGI